MHFSREIHHGCPSIATATAAAAAIVVSEISVRSYCHRYVFCMTAFCRRFSFQPIFLRIVFARFHLIRVLLFYSLHNSYFSFTLSLVVRLRTRTHTHTSTCFLHSTLLYLRSYSSYNFGRKLRDSIPFSLFIRFVATYFMLVRFLTTFSCLTLFLCKCI